MSPKGLNSPIIAEGNCQPTLRTMVCPRWARRSAHIAAGITAIARSRGPDDAIDLAAISPSSVTEVEYPAPGEVLSLLEEGWAAPSPDTNGPNPEAPSSSSEWPE